MSLKNYIFLFLITSLTYQAQPFTLMIDPTGDAKHTGREIEDTFERGITIQCAQKLKDEITQTFPNVRVVLTRVPGETVYPHQNASFANRLGVDFYLSLAFYHEPSIPAHVAIFYYLEQPTDIWHRCNPLQIYHYSQAHLINIQVTEQIAKNFLQRFQQKTINNAFVLRGMFGIPCRPLIGVKAPALCIEAGLRSKDDWKNLINPLISCIQAIIP